MVVQKEKERNVQKNKGKRFKLLDVAIFICKLCVHPITCAVGNYKNRVYESMWKVVWERRVIVA